MQNGAERDGILINVCKGRESRSYFSNTSLGTTAVLRGVEGAGESGPPVSTESAVHYVQSIWDGQELSCYSQ